MHQMLIFCVSVNVRNFDLVQCIHENYNNMKQTQDQILKGGHVNICAEGDGLSDPFLKYTFCWLTCLESCSSEVMFISRSWALDHKNHTEWQLTGGWENGPGQSQRVNVHSEIVEFFFSHQNSSEWCKQRWWDLNQSLTYLYSDSYVFQISSYFKPRKYYSGHVCHISSGIKLQGWMKFSETLRTSLKIWMGIIIISSTFYVSFLWILANEICFSSLCGYPPLSWSNRVSVLWSHHIASFAVNSSLY